MRDLVVERAEVFVVGPPTERYAWSESMSEQFMANTVLRLRAETYRILEVLTAMAALYWLMGYPQAKLCDWIHRRYRVVE